MNIAANRAILFHQASDAGQHVSHQNFATIHNIELLDNTPVIKEGQLMSHDTIMEVLSNMAGLSQHKMLQLLPENVLAHTQDALVWYMEGKVRPMLFKLNKKSVKINVPWPTLIFKVTDNELSVAALRYKRKPKADDPIYYSPLMNVYDNHTVCVGTADCPDGAELDDMFAWNKVIYETFFTHINHSHTLATKDDKETSTKQLFSFWKSLKGKTKFPLAKLNKDEFMSVEEWIE